MGRDVFTVEKNLRTIAIIGFGKSAISTIKFLRQYNPSTKLIKVSEIKTRDALGADEQLAVNNFEKDGIQFEFGRQSLEFIRGADFIMISPGVKPESPIIKSLLEFITVLSAQNENCIPIFGTDFDLFCLFTAMEHNPSRIQKAVNDRYVAVTGTNGKTTTVSLLAHIFDTVPLGNVGTPCLDYKSLGLHYPYILELSSFQLFYSNLFALPKAAVWLNFTPDHLDWHSNLDEYRQSKLELFRIAFDYDNEQRFFIFNFDDIEVRNMALQISSEKTDSVSIRFFSTDLKYRPGLEEFCDTFAYFNGDALMLSKSRNRSGDGLTKQKREEIEIIKVKDLQLVGEHNYSNVLSAILTADSLDVSLDVLREKLSSFKPVEHRLEYVCTIEGKAIYNDSKATNPHSAIQSLRAFEKSIVIVGGKEKNLDLGDFIDELCVRAHTVIAIGELKDKVFNAMKEKGFINVDRAVSLEEAFDKAMQVSSRIPVLLAPASSSFDMFINYEDRGEKFKQIVLSRNAHANR